MGSPCVWETARGVRTERANVVKERTARVNFRVAELPLNFPQHGESRASSVQIGAQKVPQGRQHRRLRPGIGVHVCWRDPQVLGPVGLQDRLQVKTGDLLFLAELCEHLMQFRKWVGAARAQTLQERPDADE